MNLLKYRQPIPGTYGYILTKCRDDNNNSSHGHRMDNNNTDIKPEILDEMKEHNIAIQNLESTIIYKFQQHYDNVFAKKIFSAFNKVITEEKFEEMEYISDDFEEPATSTILDSIWEDIESELTDPLNDKIKITNILLQIINSKYPTFNIKHFTFVVNQHDVNTATQKGQQTASSIFGHPTNGKMNISIAEDKSLCIAKAVDMKNGFPIAKWLLEAFSRFRVLGHKMLYEQFNADFDEYDFAGDKYATGYNPTTWWLRDSVFCKYIQYKNAKMALPLMTAVQALSKRALPQLNFNPQSAHVIHDNLNEFVKYIFASWALVHKLKTEREKEEMKCDVQSKYDTTQIDCWIIPRLVKPRKLASLFNLEEIFDDQADFSSLNLNFINNYSENICNKLGKVCKNKVKYPLWDLEQHLQQAGYAQNENYWVRDAVSGINQIQNQMYQMLKAAKDHKTVERCIFVIDRRNEDNIRHKNMGLQQANDSKGITAGVSDRIFLIVPRQKYCGNFRKESELIPEINWCRSKEFLFPYIYEGTKTEPIGVLDDLNGYKFVLSYHLNQTNSPSVYWYSDAGSIKFELSDMGFLFSRYFNKINEKEQKLTDNNCMILKKWMNEKQLNDVGFDNFWRQSKAMVLVYDNK